MNDAPNPTPAGWFPDPVGRHEHRYFNGRVWTADVADGGQRLVDPYGSTPTPGSGVPGGSPGGSSAGTGGATAAMVCGIVSLLIAWMPFLVVGGLALAVLALVFGVRGVRRPGAGRGRAVTGIVTGSVGLGLSVVGIWLSVLTVTEVRDFIEPAANITEVTSCAIDGSVVTVDGTIENVSGGRADFTIFVEVTMRTASGSPRIVVPVEVGSLGADQRTAWRALRTTGVAAETCTASTDVYGPFPFGIEIDRP